MAFDGIVIANLTHDIRQKLTGGKINKIAQPEKDELLFTVKNNKETLRLSVSLPAPACRLCILRRRISRAL